MQKATTPPEPQPQLAGVSLKGKEGSAKDKKTAASESNKQRNNKQEAKEPAPCACAEPAVAVAVAQANALQNGDRPQRRREKRSQSFRGFFKGLVGELSAFLSGLLGQGCAVHLLRGPLARG